MKKQENDPQAQRLSEEAVPDPDWEPVALLFLSGLSRSFVSGDPNRLRVRYFRRKGDGVLVGKAWFGPGAEGPPGHAHGGSIVAVLDEAMGGAAWLAGHAVVAVRLTTEFFKMLPLGTEATFEARVDHVEGKKVLTKSRIMDDQGEPFAAAEGLFIKLSPERLTIFAERFQEISQEKDESLKSPSDGGNP